MLFLLNELNSQVLIGRIILSSVLVISYFDNLHAFISYVFIFIFKFLMIARLLFIVVVIVLQSEAL
jgi:hypothetical protein